MADCEFLTPCPIFAKFKLEGTKNYWIRMYCKGAMQEKCARRNLKQEGKPVPPEMMPDGSELK